MLDFLKSFNIENFSKKKHRVVTLSECMKIIQIVIRLFSLYPQSVYWTSRLQLERLLRYLAMKVKTFKHSKRIKSIENLRNFIGLFNVSHPLCIPNIRLCPK